MEKDRGKVLALLKASCEEIRGRLAVVLLFSLILGYAFIFSTSGKKQGSRLLGGDAYYYSHYYDVSEYSVNGLFTEVTRPALLEKTFRQGLFVEAVFLFLWVLISMLLTEKIENLRFIFCIPERIVRKTYIWGMSVFSVIGSIIALMTRRVGYNRTAGSYGGLGNACRLLFRPDRIEVGLLTDFIQTFAVFLFCCCITVLCENIRLRFRERIFFPVLGITAVAVLFLVLIIRGKMFFLYPLFAVGAKMERVLFLPTVFRILLSGLAIVATVRIGRREERSNAQNY